ncbi:hypothetical protein Tco_0631044, partial [Tanacetum coccineum]
YGYIKNHKKTVKNKQARTRESEEYKKKPKNKSRKQSQEKSNPQSNPVNNGQQQSTIKRQNPQYSILTLKVSQKSKNSLSSLIGP